MFIIKIIFFEVAKQQQCSDKLVAFWEMKAINIVRDKEAMLIQRDQVA